MAGSRHSAHASHSAVGDVFQCHPTATPSASEFCTSRSVVEENVGDQDPTILGTRGDVIVDGKTYDNKDPTIADGNNTLRVNGVAAHAIDLTGLITKPGIHSVEYRRGTAISNRLILQSPNR